MITILVVFQNNRLDAIYIQAGISTQLRGTQSESSQNKEKVL